MTTFIKCKSGVLVNADHIHRIAMLTTDAGHSQLDLLIAIAKPEWLIDGQDEEFTFVLDDQINAHWTNAQNWLNDLIENGDRLTHVG